MASAFGPYLVGGIRFEQVLAYPLALYAVVAGWRGRWWRGRDVLVIGGCLAGVAAIAALGLLLPKVNTSAWGWGSPFANLDNLLLPLAVLIAASGMVDRVGRERAQQDVTAAVAIGCAVVSVVSVVSVVQAVAPGLVTWLLPAFWGEGGTPERALTMGRITGLLGQPSLAGAMFTLGVLAVGYAFRDRPRLMLPILALVSLGGLLTISKNFLFVGLPIAALLALRIVRRSRYAMAATAVVVVVAPVVLWLAGWSGFRRISLMFPGGRLELAALTGNRYGEGGVVGDVVDAVLVDHPWLGYGARGLDAATDSAFTQALVLAGVVGSALVVLLLAWLVVALWRRRAVLDRDELWLYAPLTLGLVVLAFGSPVLTANRVAVVLWALVALLLSRSVLRESTNLLGGSCRRLRRSLGRTAIRGFRQSRRP